MFIRKLLIHLKMHLEGDQSNVSNGEHIGTKFECNKRNISRMKKGRAPQKFDDKTRTWKSMELHQIPPQREGGLVDFIEVWPEQNTAIDESIFIGEQ